MCHQTSNIKGKGWLPLTMAWTMVETLQACVRSIHPIPSEVCRDRPRVNSTRIVLAALLSTLVSVLVGLKAAADICVFRQRYATFDRSCTCVLKLFSARPKGVLGVSVHGCRRMSKFAVVVYVNPFETCVVCLIGDRHYFVAPVQRKRCADERYP